MADRYAETRARNQRRYRRMKRTLINEAKMQPCQRCGGRFDPPAMDFHHRDGDGLGRKGSGMTHLSLSRVPEEIEKCDVLCSNCHRMVTYEERKCR